MTDVHRGATDEWSEGMRKGTRFVATVAIGLTLLTACGGGDGGGGEGAGDGGAASTVTMRDNAFVPGDPTIRSGEVELVNAGESSHTFTIEGEDIDVEVEAGQTATTTVDLEPGTYTLFCSFHRSQGMETTLTVEA
jgi:plastocyanin